MFPRSANREIPLDFTRNSYVAHSHRVDVRLEVRVGDACGSEGMARDHLRLLTVRVSKFNSKRPH